MEKRWDHCACIVHFSELILHLRPIVRVSTYTVAPIATLQVGNVMVLSELENINKVEKLLGNTLKRLNEPPIVTIFVGIFHQISCLAVFISFGECLCP